MTDSQILVEKRFLVELKEIFEKVAPNAQVWAYGSRVNGNAHSGSDLDLALVGNADISVLKAALENSNIPFLVDVVKFENLSESFQKEILKKYVVIK